MYIPLSGLESLLTILDAKITIFFIYYVLLGKKY